MWINIQSNQPDRHTYVNLDHVTCVERYPNRVVIHFSGGGSMPVDTPQNIEKFMQEIWDFVKEKGAVT